MFIDFQSLSQVSVVTHWPLVYWISNQLYYSPTPLYGWEVTDTSLNPIQSINQYYAPEFISLVPLLLVAVLVLQDRKINISIHWATCKPFFQKRSKYYTEELWVLTSVDISMEGNAKQEVSGFLHQLQKEALFLSCESLFPHHHSLTF